MVAGVPRSRDRTPAALAELVELAEGDVEPGAVQREGAVVLAPPDPGKRPEMVDRRLDGAALQPRRRGGPRAPRASPSGRRPAWAAAGRPRRAAGIAGRRWRSGPRGSGGSRRGAPAAAQRTRPSGPA